MHEYACIIRFMHDTAKRIAIQGLSQKRAVRAVVFDYGSVLCLEQPLEDTSCSKAIASLFLLAWARSKSLTAANCTEFAFIVVDGALENASLAEQPPGLPRGGGFLAHHLEV